MLLRFSHPRGWKSCPATQDGFAGNDNRKKVPERCVSRVTGRRNHLITMGLIGDRHGHRIGKCAGGDIPRPGTLAKCSELV